MRLDRIIYPIAVRCIRVPVIRQIANLLYSRLCSRSSLPMDINRAKTILGKLPPRPTGHAYWDENDRPVWGECKYDLTVIIPFYNTEQYAKACIDSVLNQKTGYRFEIILIDDGSPDGCAAIIDSYQGCPDVRVIHQKNSGLSVARNVGIKCAQGRYLCFVDSDDLLCQGAIEALMSAASKYGADIVDGSFKTITKSGKIRRNYSHSENASSYGAGMYGYACGKVFKRDIFSEICFPGGYWFEDTICANLLFLKAPISITISDCVFLYRSNPKGISSSCAKNPKCIDKLYVIQEILESFVHLNMNLDTKRRNLIWELGPSLYGRIHGLKEEEIQAAFIFAADLVEQYNLIPQTKSESFYENELWQAFIHRQYYRWKWASFLM